MRLVDYDCVVGAEERIGACFREKDAVRHELDARGVRDLFRKTVLVSDGRADLASELFGDAFRDGDGGEAARLGTGDAAPVRAESELHRHLRQLRRFPRARVSADDDGLAAAERVHDLSAVR